MPFDLDLVWRGRPRRRAMVPIVGKMTAVVQPLKVAVAADYWWTTIAPDERKPCISAPVCRNPSGVCRPVDPAIHDQDVLVAQRAGDRHHRPPRISARGKVLV